MKQNFIIQFVQLLKNLLFDMWLGIVVEKDWAHSVDQWQLQFSVHPINLLSIHLRCNSFAGIQKAIVDLKSSSPPNSDCDFFFFFLCNLGFGRYFGVSSSVQSLSWSSPVVI